MTIFLVCMFGEDMFEKALFGCFLSLLVAVYG